MAQKAAKQKNNLIFFLCSLLIVLLLFLSVFNLSSVFKDQEVLGTEAEINLVKLEEEKTFWENFVVEHPTYRDGWLKLAQVLYQLGDLDYSQGAFETARAIDPNSRQVFLVEKQLGF